MDLKNLFMKFEASFYVVLKHNVTLSEEHPNKRAYKFHS